MISNFSLFEAEIFNWSDIGLGNKCISLIKFASFSPVKLQVKGTPTEKPPTGKAPKQGDT